MFLPPSLFSPALRCFVFQHLACFSQKCDFQSGLVVGLEFGDFLSREIRPFFFHVGLFAFSSCVSRHFRAIANVNIFSGSIFGALVLYFPAFGENVRFHSGFSFRIWAPVLWCYVFQHLALVIFEPFGRLWRRLGLPLGLVGPPWATDRFCRFFGSPLCRPKWSHDFCPNAQKQMVLGLFMRKGRFVEIVASGPLCSESSCFLELFVNSGGRLVAQNGLVDANLVISFDVSKVFPCLCFALFGCSWARLG